jgi:hypothetical protein
LNLIILPKPKGVETKGDDIENIMQEPKFFRKISIKESRNKEGAKTIKKNAYKDPKHGFIRKRIFLLYHLK